MKHKWEDIALFASAVIGVGLAVRGARHARRDLRNLLVDGVNGSAWIAGMVSLAVERIRIAKRVLMLVTAMVLLSNCSPHHVPRILRIAAIVTMILDDWKSYIVARGRHAAEEVERRRKQERTDGER